MINTMQNFKIKKIEMLGIQIQFEFHKIVIKNEISVSEHYFYRSHL